MREKSKKFLENKAIINICLILITIVSCMPLFINGIEGHFGQDLGFHLNRIEGIVTELKAGHFPVRMESHWMEGYGYPVSIYYGDVLLYIPALLRLLGIGVVTSYKIYVLLITYATVVVTYICIKKIIGRKDIALICSLIYTMSSYRIVNVFIRAAVGEYSAMLFFPIVMLAMYNIYNAPKDISLRNKFVNASLLTLGISGLINTHMLSTEMVGIVLIVFCIINFRKTFTSSVLVTYVIAGVEIVIVNLFYIVPFVDYFINENVNINNVVGNARLIQESGMHLREYISFFKIPFANIDVAGDDRLLVTPGIVCIIILLAAIVMWIMGKADSKMKIGVVSVLALLFITSCYFPWNFLATHSKVGDFLAQVQFPWRYMGIVVMLLTLMAAWVFERIDNTRIISISYIVVVILTLISMIWFTYEYRQYAQLVTYEEEEDLNSSDMGYIEYLRSDTVREQFVNKETVTGDVVISETNRNGTDRTYTVLSGNIGGRVTLPIVNYKGYELSDDNGTIDIVDGDNNLIAFDVKGNYNGSMNLKFVWPWYWIMAEIISMLGIIAIVTCNIFIKRKDTEEAK